MSKLAEEILSEVGATRFKWDIKGCDLLPSEREKILLALIDEKLFGVRLSVEQAYIETLSTPHEEAWDSLKVD